MQPKPKLTSDDPHAAFRGRVSRVVDHPGQTWAEISIEGTDALYGEIRVPNPLKNEDGTSITLKPGDHVTLAIRVEATPRPRPPHN